MTENYNQTTGENIKLFRMARGLNLRDMAVDLDISYPALSKMENGSQRIDTDFLVKVASYFKVSVNQLLGIEDMERKQDELWSKNEVKEELVIRDQLLYILDNYLIAKEENFKEHPMGDHIRNVMPKIISKEVGINKERYFISGSIGQGNWAEIPWISAFARELTTSATKGYYLVYLFKADMSGVYISINQGWTYFKEKYGTSLGREMVQKTTKIIRNQLNTIPLHADVSEISLGGRGGLSKGYEHGHICGKYYDLNSLPESEVIINDFKDLLITYNEIERLIGGRTISQFNDYILLEEDGKFLEEDEKEEGFQEKTNELIRNEELENGKEDDGPRNRPEPLIDKRERKRWPRSAKNAAIALRLSNYNCAYDENHKTFISKTTLEPFMEMHHLVLMMLQSEYEYDLDRVENLLSLCPNCHRAIHHGTDEVKGEILRKLFNERRDKLEEVGIEITFNDLKKAYMIQ